MSFWRRLGIDILLCELYYLPCNLFFDSLSMKLFDTNENDDSIQCYVWEQSSDNFFFSINKPIRISIVALLLFFSLYSFSTLIYSSIH
jgi:hypothetical protein